MVETLHPAVFTVERAGTPTIVGVSTSTTAFVGTTARGPTDELGFVTSFSEFGRLFGTGFPDTFLEDALFLYFQNGGARAFIGRVAGSGAAEATVNAPALEGAPSAAVIVGSNAEPFNLEPGDTIEISVDGGGAQIFTFAATAAALAAAGAAVPTPGGADTLVVDIDGTGLQTVAFAGTESTVALIVQAINTQLTGASVIDIAGTITITSDTRGLGSSVAIDASSTAGGLTATGFTGGQNTAGTGNVQDIDAVTTAEVLALLATLTDATATADVGRIKLTHDTAGVASTLEVTTAAAAFGFPAGVVTGATAVGVDMLQINALNVGSWGNGITATSERWRALTTASLSASDTTVVVNDVTKVELGDIIVISDGTNQDIVHVNALDIGTKTLTFTPPLTFSFASGVLVRSASSHRAKTELSLATAAADTKINVAQPNQIRVGTELSFDDGTNLVFRLVERVNGTEITLNTAIGFVYAAGTLVATQHNDLLISVDGELDPTHRFLSLQEEDNSDFVELRLNGPGNESANIKIVDLAPSIATPINNHLAPFVSLALTGGNDGAVPLDNDFIGSDDPVSGLQLLTTLNPGDVNIIAIPGITTTPVQQALSDFAETIKGPQGQKVVALIDPPLTIDTTLEVRDWRLNVHNRDTSYSALYYPWLVIRDRRSTNANATKIVPPSGAMAGIYGRVDAQIGVWEPPANQALVGVIGTNSLVTDGQWDILNPIGINVIRAFPGEGIRVMGARTLTNTFDGRHYVHIRRLLNFDKISISIALRRFLWKGIQPSLFRQVERAISAFHENLWRAGALFPDNNFLDAQFVKVDEENNPLAGRKLGQLFVDAGINPPFPAEFIIFRIGLFDGETSIDEIVGG